jgi:putative transposase
MRNPFRYFNSSPEVIRLAVMMYVCYPLSLRQVCGRWLNNRAENSHQAFRRREDIMAKFRDVKTLQKFAAAHASIHNHFNQERHLYSREIFKQNRSAALAEWRQLAA